MRYVFFFIIALSFAYAPQRVNAQVAAASQEMTFGRLVVPVSGCAVKIEPNGSISQGSQCVVSPIEPREGRYNITGPSGTIDISVTNVIGCTGTVTLSGFTANWNGTNYPDISTTPITGVPFDGNEDLELGARITYGSNTALAQCNNIFDLTTVVY